MSNEALILDLSADLVPVRPRHAWREAALPVALGLIELALLAGFGLMRPDMGRAIGSAYMMWKLGSLAVLAGISCTVAIRSFSPTEPPRSGLTGLLALAGMAVFGGMIVDPGVADGHTLLDRLSPGHGILCALSIIALALPMMAMMAVLMRRGAPAHPEGSAFAAGIAAGTSGAFVFAFCCPVNDPLYVIVWYAAGCSAVIAATRWLLPLRFRL